MPASVIASIRIRVEVVPSRVSTTMLGSDSDLVGDVHALGLCVTRDAEAAKRDRQVALLRHRHHHRRPAGIARPDRKPCPRARRRKLHPGSSSTLGRLSELRVSSTVTTPVATIRRRGQKPSWSR